MNTITQNYNMMYQVKDTATTNAVPIYPLELNSMHLPTNFGNFFDKYCWEFGQAHYCEHSKQARSVDQDLWMWPVLNSSMMNGFQQGYNIYNSKNTSSASLIQSHSSTNESLQHRLEDSDDNKSGSSSGNHSNGKLQTYSEEYWLNTEVVEDHGHKLLVNKKSKSPAKSHKESSIQFSTRKDVVNKSIFRFMRKFYTRDFKKYYNFTKIQSDDPEYNRDTFISKLVKYATLKFGEEVPANMTIFLLSVIDPKGRYLTVDPKYHGLRADISGLLYSYNKSKMLKLVDHQEFIILLSYFVNQENIERQIVKKTSSKIIRSYVKQIDSLKTLCY